MSAKLGLDLGQAGAAHTTAVVDDTTTAFGGHTGTETMLPNAANLGWLILTFHKIGGAPEGAEPCKVSRCGRSSSIPAGIFRFIPSLIDEAEGLCGPSPGVVNPKPSPPPPPVFADTQVPRGVATLSDWSDTRLRSGSRAGIANAVRP